MSGKSDELRRKAFEHLKLAKLSRSLEERRGHRTIARSYETLADNEAWLEGERRKGTKPPEKP
jgi:hypothetical protein